MTAEEEFERWFDNHPRYKFEPTWHRAWAREGYLEAHYYHQQEKIDEWKRNWQLEMSHASKCEERVKKLEEKIDRLKEGINAALSYNLPYLVEKALKELLEEPK